MLWVEILASDEAKHLHVTRGVIDINHALEVLASTQAFEAIDHLLHRLINEGGDGHAHEQAVNGADNAHAEHMRGHDPERHKDDHRNEEANEVDDVLVGLARWIDDRATFDLIDLPRQELDGRLTPAMEQMIGAGQHPKGDQQRQRHGQARKELIPQPHEGVADHWSWTGHRRRHEWDTVVVSMMSRLVQSTSPTNSRSL